MPKKLIQRRREITDRLNEVARTLREENREMTQEEREEVNGLRRELDWINLETVAASNTGNARETASRYQMLRDAIAARRSVTLALREEPGAGAVTSQVTADLDNLQPLTVGEILMPIEEGLIWNCVGIRIPTGLRGRYEWPVVDDTTEAEFAGELDELEETKIAIDSIPLVQNRLGSRASTSREAVFNSDGEIENLIRTMLPLRCIRAINRVLFSTSKLEKAKIQGPFVGLEPTALSAVGDKTFKELNVMKAGLLGKGFEAGRMCWVMTEATKAMLEATPKDKGSGIMVVENDRLCGLPIYCTHYIGEGNIGLGDWGFQCCGQVGGVSLIFDPYTGAAKDQFKFTLNTYYGTATLRKEAFALAKIAE